MFYYDPVCGKRVNRNKAHIELEFEGTTFLLCCPACQAEFERWPERYARGGAADRRRRRVRS